MRRGIAGDVVRVQDEGNHAVATRQQPATFMLRRTLRMRLKRKKHGVLNPNPTWHEDQSISRQLKTEKVLACESSYFDWGRQFKENSITPCTSRSEVSGNFQLLEAFFTAD